MKKAITTATEPKSVHRTAKEKRQGAARTSTWRERKAGEIVEVRDLDKAISEAVAVHARSMTPAAQKAFLSAIVALAQDGLVYQGHDRGNARNRILDRLEYWVGHAPTSGTVRAAADRKAAKAKSSVAA